MFTVVVDDVVRSNGAHQGVGLPHDDLSRAGLLLLVQDVVDGPPVCAHHLQQLLLQNVVLPYWKVYGAGGRKASFRQEPKTGDQLENVHETRKTLVLMAAGSDSS